MLEVIAFRYAEYAASGSDAWDATIDVHNRPQWLKNLAGIAPDQIESPAVDPQRAEFADVRRPFRPQLIVAQPVSTASGGSDSKVYPTSEKYVETHCVPGSEEGKDAGGDSEQVTEATVVTVATEEENSIVISDVEP